MFHNIHVRVTWQPAGADSPLLSCGTLGMELRVSSFDSQYLYALGTDHTPSPHSGCFCAGYSGIHNLSVLWHHIFLLIIVEMIWGWDKVMLPSWEWFLIRILHPGTAWDCWHGVFSVTRRAVKGQDAPLLGGPCPFTSFRSCSLTLLSFNKEKKINSGEEDRDVSVLLIDQDLIRETIM